MSRAKVRTLPVIGRLEAPADLRNEAGLNPKEEMAHLNQVRLRASEWTERPPGIPADWPRCVGFLNRQSVCLIVL